LLLLLRYQLFISKKYFAFYSIVIVVTFFLAACTSWNAIVFILNKTNHGPW